MDRVISMRVFVRAASVGSLSAAARHLGMSPAMATKHVNSLEVRLGVKLFHRTTRRLSLTEAGSNYLEACQRILPEIDEAEAAATSQRVKATGLLRMNVPLSFGTRYVAPLIAEFSHRHPEVIPAGMISGVVNKWILSQLMRHGTGSIFPWHI